MKKLRIVQMALFSIFAVLLSVTIYMKVSNPPVTADEEKAVLYFLYDYMYQYGYDLTELSDYVKLDKNGTAVTGNVKIDGTNFIVTYYTDKQFADIVEVGDE